MRRAIFLDRDGVLIRNEVRDGRPYAITAGEPVEIIDGVLEACARLKRLGFLLVMATNQPDVATGRTPRWFVEEINASLATALTLDGIEVCFHGDADNCDCRKPKPGLLLEAARKLDIDPAQSFMVGDRWRDIEAGQRAGCRTVLIEYHYRDKKPEAPDYVAMSLLAAVDWIASTARTERAKWAEPS
jgi:D-glycero-D-manno-heptose 1,7-bisphosphate phosphatase